MLQLTLIDHLESNLGTTVVGWKDDDAAVDVAIAGFEDRPVSGVQMYCTMGLSFHPLPLGGKLVRQELIFAADDRFEGVRIAACLSMLAEDIVRRQRPLMRGEIIGTRSPIILGTLMEQLFACSPVPLTDSLAVCEQTDPPTIFTWVLPIHDNEAHLARSRGWQALEAALADKDDLWDLRRRPVL